MSHFHKIGDGITEAHEVGEVVGHNYRLTKARSVEEGKFLYEGKRVSDGLPVSVCCLNFAANSPIASEEEYEKEKKLLLDCSDPSYLESFEATISDGKRFYIVKALADAAVPSKTEPEHTIEPELRSSPEGSRCTAYRRGQYHLEVDIPSVGLWSGAAFSRIFLLAVWFGIVFMLAAWSIRDFLREAYAEGTLLGVCCFLLMLAGFYLMYQIPRAVFGHSTIVITEGAFDIRTTLENKPKPRDLANDFAKAMADETWLDKLFCKQISGKTSNVSRIELKESKSSRLFSAKSLVLWEIGARHKLELDLPEADKLWLFSEIHEILDNIRMQQIVP